MEGGGLLEQLSGYSHSSSCADADADADACCLMALGHRQELPHPLGDRLETAASSLRGTGLSMSIANRGLALRVMASRALGLRPQATGPQPQQ